MLAISILLALFGIAYIYQDQRYKLSDDGTPSRPWLWTLMVVTVYSATFTILEPGLIPVDPALFLVMQVGAMAFGALLRYVQYPLEKDYRRLAYYHAEKVLANRGDHKSDFRAMFDKYLESFDIKDRGGNPRPVFRWRNLAIFFERPPFLLSSGAAEEMIEGSAFREPDFNQYMDEGSPVLH